MSHDLSQPNRRVLIVDDNTSIHDDFRRVLGAPADSNELSASEAALFGAAEVESRRLVYEIDSAFQGEEGLAKGREQLGACPLPGELHRSVQPLRRHAECSRAQRPSPGGLEDTDGLGVADQLASHRMLGRLVVQPPGMQ